MSKWSHLPNAVHIDAILAHVKDNPEKWEAANGTMYASAWDAAWNAAWKAAWNAAGNPAYSAAWYPAFVRAWYAAVDAAVDAAWNEAGNEAWSRGARGAILALMTYPDCAYMLNMSPEQIKMYAHLDVKGAWLLYPAAIAMEKEYV